MTYEPERVVIRARSPGRGLLILSDNDYPGWKATVDGRAADVERVDYLFRGVALGPGAHTVEFRFEPLSWRIGWIVSLVSLVAAGAGGGYRASAARPRLSPPVSPTVGGTASRPP